jgi:hypothetical protein
MKQTKRHIFLGYVHFWYKKAFLNFKKSFFFVRGYATTATTAATRARVIWVNKFVKENEKKSML